MIYHCGEYSRKPELPEILKGQLDAGDREQAIVLKNYNEALEAWEKEQKWPVYTVSFDIKKSASGVIQIRAANEDEARQFVEEESEELFESYGDACDININFIKKMGELI